MGRKESSVKRTAYLSDRFLSIQSPSTTEALKLWIQLSKLGIPETSLTLNPISDQCSAAIAIQRDLDGHYHFDSAIKPTIHHELTDLLKSINCLTIESGILQCPQRNIVLPFDQLELEGKSEEKDHTGKNQIVLSSAYPVILISRRGYRILDCNYICKLLVILLLIWIKSIII